MRRTTVAITCNHCGANLNDNTFNSKDQIMVSSLQVQSRLDSRANLHVSALTNEEVLDFCDPYCLREYVSEYFKDVFDALAKEDLEERIKQDEEAAAGPELY